MSLTTWGSSAYFAWSVTISGRKMQRESASVSRFSDAETEQRTSAVRECRAVDNEEVDCSLTSGRACPVAAGPPSEDEAVELGERLDRLAADLAPSLRAFLLEILALAEGAVSSHVDEVTTRTCADAMLAIHRAYCATDNPLGLNPQPIPTLPQSTV
jgi:hypothetical protein